MTRICIIGNSHAGMLAGALHMPDLGHVEATVFACPKFCKDHFELGGGLLRSRSAELDKFLNRIDMPNEVNLAEFDKIILVGQTASVYTAMAPLRTHLVAGWPGTGAAMSRNTSHAPLARPLMSHAGYLATLCDKIEHNLTHELATGIRDITDAPIYVVPQPCLSVKVLAQRANNAEFSRIAGDGDGPALIRALSLAHERSFASVSGTCVLAQPPETLAHGFLTTMEFSRDAVRYDGKSPRPEGDTLHASPALGRIFVNQIVGLKAA